MGKALAAWLMVAGALAGTPTTPREVVESAVKRVVVALQEVERRPEAEEARRLHADRQRAEIRRVAAHLFDFDEMARRALSRHWIGRTPAERDEFVQLFTSVLERSYLARIEAYTGETIQYVGESVDGAYAIVRSKVISRRKTETPLDYRLHRRDGTWRVYDLTIDGVSFVSTYRQEFDRIVRLSSYPALVDRLKQRGLETNVLQGVSASASPRTIR